MSDDHRFCNDVESSELRAFIDQTCQRFAQQWRGGEGPRIESFLEQTPAAARKEVLRRLLLLEVAFTSGSSGPPPDMSQWRLRFPNDESVLRHVWRRIQETHVRNAEDTVLEGVVTSTRYSDLRHFRTGGMADLYLAHDAELRRDTVVKRLRDKYCHDPDYGKRLAIEAEITGRLDHPGIVPVYGIGEDWEGRPFYVMRMIRGTELQTAIDDYHAQGGFNRRGRANRQLLSDLLEHLIAAVNTVAFAHDAGIIHGDLKPMNIMIGRYGETFVVDWGLARTFQHTTEFRKGGEPELVPHEHIPRDLRGFTLGYVSPEQFAGRDDISPASDIYSLGATLYQMLTNRTPYRRPEPEVGERLAFGEIPSPRSVNPRIPKALEAVCQKAMQVAPNNRYRTAKEFAADLRNWLQDEEVEAAPDGRVNKLLRWFRNHQAAAAATLLISMVLTVAGSLLVSKRIEVERVEQRFDAALDTCEQLAGPSANFEKNQLDVVYPLAQKMKDFCSTFLGDEQFAASNSPQVAKLHELRALANFALEPNEAQLLADLQHAASIYEALLETAPQDSQKTYRLACNHLMQGRVLVRYNETASAENLLNTALMHLRELQHRVPPPVEREVLLRREAEAHHALGELFLTQANTTGNEHHCSLSASHFLRSRALREQLVRDVNDTDRVTLRTIERDLARSDGYLGDLYLRRGDLQRAQDAYGQSLQRRRSLFLANPSDPEHRFQYARGLANFANVERISRCNLQQAITYLNEAHRLQEDLADDYPADPDFRVDLGWTLATLTEMHIFLAAESTTEVRTECLGTAATLAQRACATFLACSVKDPLVIRGLALSRALQAEAIQDSDLKRAKDQAQECTQLLKPLAGDLAQDDYITLALATAILGRTDDCLEALDAAYQQRTHAVAQLQSHAEFGLKSINHSPAHRERFAHILDNIRTPASLPTPN